LSSQTFIDHTSPLPNQLGFWENTDIKKKRDSVKLLHCALHNHCYNGKPEEFKTELQWRMNPPELTAGKKPTEHTTLDFRISRFAVPVGKIILLSIA